MRILLGLVVLAGCKQDPIDKFRTMTDAMCACQDRACRQHVRDDNYGVPEEFLAVMRKASTSDEEDLAVLYARFQSCASR